MCPDVSLFISIGTAELEDNSVTAAKIASNVDVTAKGFDADKVDGKDADDSASNLPVLDASAFLALAQVVGNVPALDANGKLILTDGTQIGTKTGDLAELWDKTTKIVFADVDSGEFNVASKFLQLDASADVPLAQIPDVLTGKDATDNFRIDGTRAMVGDIVFDNAVDRLIKMDATEMVRFESDASALTMGADIDIGDNRLGLGSFTELTIAAGVITVTSSFHNVDTQDDDATDDLNTITAGAYIGQLLVLSPNDAGRTIVCKDGTDNLSLEGDFSMDHNQDTITLIWTGGIWRELSRSNNET